MKTPPFDPTTPVLSFDDMRLTRAFQQDPLRCATINEYAAATGIPVDEVLAMLSVPFRRGELDVEAVGGEVFVHTAPAGRPAPAGMAQTLPNLWELLRRTNAREEAHGLWRLFRDLESGGWRVDTDSRFPVPGGTWRVSIGLRFAMSTVPVVVLPDLGGLSSQAGPLTALEVAGVGLCAVTCAHRDLDAAVTAVRQWMLGRPARAGLDVLVLEAPRYQPVLLTGDDGSIAPRSVTIDAITAAR